MIVENQKKSKGDDSRNFRMTAKLVVIVLYTLLSSLLLSSEAFALTQVASPGSCSSTGSGDDNWSNPDRARVSDNNRADTRLDDWQDSELLECTDFGFSIPVAATIDGISVRIERRAQVDNRMRDRDLQLIKGGTTVGSNYADTTTWFPTSDTYASYGGAADLWGTTWTPAEINAGNFGVGLRVRKDTNSGGNTRAYVDHVEITIHYTDSAVSAALLAAYQFDEFSWDGSPGEVVDSSGNGNDGTSIGGATTIEPGRLCRAGIFDGSNYVQVSNLSSLLGNTATLSFWIKTTQVGNDTNWQAPGVAGVEQSGGTNDIFWGWLDAAGHIGISKGNDNTAKSTVAINDGTWHHVVLSRNAGDGAYKIYLDGALNKSGTTNSGIVSTSFSSIGRIEDTAGSHEYFVGELDEVFIFDGVLTDADVASIYALQSAGKNLDGSERDCPTPSTCYVDDFNRAALGTDWSVSNSSGSFGDPRIVNNRLRLTDASGNVATAATLQKLFPGAGNLIVLEFDYFAYNGNGADGIAVTFSDSSITPSPGGYGGSLGYAQRCGVNGFAGGWLGVGIDEYGNFNNDDECRGDGPPPSGRVIDSLSVRGSGSGTVGYRRLSGTGTLRPGIDQSGATPAPGHRYRVTIDHLTTPGQAIYTVERQTTPGGPWVTHLTGDALASVGQAPVPENWILSFTGSTGGSTNIHEIDNISVCATKMLPVSTTVNHFRFYHDGSGLTCAPENIQVRACLDSACSVEASGDITATLAPSGWIDGSPVTFASSDTLQLQHTTAETVALGVISSTPSALNPPRCYIGGVEQANCNITFHDSGFVFDIPNHDASTTQNITIKAIRKDNETQQCVPGFTDVTKTVNFWSTYVDPGTGTLAVNVNDTDVAGASPGTELDLDFDSTGVASLQVVYPDAGQMQLDARYEGSGDDAGLVMTGQDMFVARPDHFTLTGIVCADGTANPGAADAGGAAFCAAGEDFRVTVAARNAVGDITPNFGRESAPESVALATTLVAPVGGSNPVLAGSFGSFGEDCAGDPATAGTACGTFTWPEVGIVTLTPSIASGNYLGAGNVTGSVSGNVGRFHPARFGVTHTPDVGCGTTFTYAGLSGSKVGQPFSVTGTITARNVAGATTANYAGAFAKLGTGDVTAMPMQGAAAAAGVLTWNVDSLTFAAGVGAMTATARYAFTAEGGPQAMHLRVMADDGEASGEENDSGKAVEYRLGRLRLQNAYGAELADIAVPMQAEYYDAGGYYRRNDADNCTALTLADHLELRNPQTDSGDWQSGDTTMTVGGGSTAALPINSPLVSGDAGLVFTAPGAGHTGYVDIRTSLTTDHPWLGHAWNCDAAAPSEACGRVSFGLYQGSRHHIYLRERY